MEEKKHPEKRTLRPRPVSKSSVKSTMMTSYRSSYKRHDRTKEKEQGRSLSHSKNHKSPAAADRTTSTSGSQWIRFFFNKLAPSVGPKQFTDHMSSLKTLIKQHNEKSETLIEPIRLTFGDEEEGDKAKFGGKRTEEEKDGDL
ncbi:hypothetical protein Tco_0625729 [Tanacetum coccineum]|uniref:Uncharacterized protein n=1 Tax=Tanacetum coccineum TaxID=301880 RepID=A0ABQ4WHJ9_9ASTR